MDLVDFDRERYEAIVADFEAFSRELGFSHIEFIPISAIDGDNVVNTSDRTPWYEGGTLLSYLETVPIGEHDGIDGDFRFPVQYVLRPDLTYRGFCGRVASGVVRTGDVIEVLPSRQRSTIAAIDTYEGPIEEAWAPMSVTLRLADEIDISRGDMLVHPSTRPQWAVASTPTWCG